MVAARLRQAGFKSRPPLKELSMWFAYALRNDQDGWLYIGMTSDLERRLWEHNKGYNRSTKYRVPLRLIYSERCASRSEARELEKYLKSGKGREFLRSQQESGGGNSTVESHSSKVMVAGSNPVPRSRN